LPIVYINISESYLELEDYENSLNYLNNALKISQLFDNKFTLQEVYLKFYKYYFKLKNFENALEYYKLYKTINDSIFNKEKSEQLIKIQTKYETVKTEKENELLIANEEKNKLTIQRQRIFFITLSAILILILFIAIQLFKLNKEKKKVNEILSAKNTEILQQKEEILMHNEILEYSNKKIESQKDEIEKQRDNAIEQNEIISNQNQYIKNSIIYASRIQKALLPSINDLEKQFSDYFIFFKPRDIVSGDFYWYKNINNNKFLVVSDCTGHGVPGAFMSLLGISYLNEITNFNHNIEPAFILEELRIRVKQALNNTDNKINQRDGMDMVICKIDESKKIITFSGANNSIIVVNNDELIEYKAIKNPVGSYVNEKKFENNYINYETNNLIYLYTDGYIDQLHGKTNEKFKISRFKNLILESKNLLLKEQQEKFDLEFENWKTPNFKQIDDILIIGIKLN